jgi:hypothetical protein
MATVNKDFRVKHGLIVEGENATVDGSDIITEAALTGGTQTNISVTYDPATKLVSFAAENGVDDSTTDDLEEGTENLYFTDQRAIDAVGGSATPDNEPNTVVKRDENGDFAAGTVSAERIEFGPSGGGYTPGTIGRDSETGPLRLENGGSGFVILGNSTPMGDTGVYVTSSDSLDNLVATQGNISTHSDLTTGVHGVSGDVVGTTDTQDLSNKRVIDTLYFSDGVTIAEEGEIAVKATTHEFEVKANYGNLDLKTVATGADVNITSQDGDILLNADGFAYLDSKDEANKIATQGYVDAATAGLNVHDSVKAATVENINIATALENGDILDGVTLATGNRVLVKDQTTKTQNGVYVVQVSGAAVRAEDYNSPPEVDAGDFIFVEGGDANGKTGWVQTQTITTVESDNIEFTQFSGAGTYVGGTGIHLDANTIELDFTEFDTDDITEGTENLYFTDTRAVDALEGTTPNFTTIEVDSLIKQVAAIVSSDAGQTIAYAFPKADYRSAKFLVKVAHGSHTEVSEVLLTLDTSDNIAITEFAVVSTNGSASAITAGIQGSNVRLLVTPTNADSTITVFGTLISSQLGLFA